MAIKSVSIRIEKEMLDKLAFIADYEGRSVNSHILVLIRESIQKFEQTNGNIDGKIRPDLNVKPTRKNEILIIIHNTSAACYKAPLFFSPSAQMDLHNQSTNRLNNYISLAQYD